VYSRSSRRMETGSLALLMSASGVLFQRLQPRDHRLDPRARLLVLGQQLRALAGQLFLLLAQALVLLLELARAFDQRVHPRGDVVELGNHLGRVHSGTIGSVGGAVKAAQARGASSGSRPACPDAGFQPRMKAWQRDASNGGDSQ